MAFNFSRLSTTRVRLGRREKLVGIGIAGLLLIGALHFLIFSPRNGRLMRIQSEYQTTQNEYTDLGGRNYDEARIRAYRERTEPYAQQAGAVIERENLIIRPPNAEEDNPKFREIVRRLRRKWLDYVDSARGGTDLTFIGRQTDMATVPQGQYTWDISESLPNGVTGSFIRDALRQARGKYRLIRGLSNDPVAQRQRQLQFNEFLFQMGINPYLIGADRVSDFSPLTWEAYRLPVPLDAFSALSHVELLLNAMFPPPFDGATMAQAAADPESLTPEQREEYEAWQRGREAERFGNTQLLGLETLLEVTYSPRLVNLNRSLLHVERLVDMAISDEIAAILMVKIAEDTGATPRPDPWTIPEVTVEQPVAAAAARGRRGFAAAEGGYAGDPYGGAPGAAYGSPGAAYGEPGAPYGEPGAPYGSPWGEGGEADVNAFWAQSQSQAAQPEAPPEDYFASLAPIFMRITGDYARVWSFLLHISTGANLYSIEEMSLYIAPTLPDGHVVAEVWILAPLTLMSTLEM